MTPEQYYWHVRRPQMLRARMAAIAIRNNPIPIVTIALTRTNGSCTFKINDEVCEAKQVPVGSNVTIQVIPGEGYELAKWSDDSTDLVRTISNIQANVNLNARLQVPMTSDGTWSPVPPSSSISPLTWDATNKKWTGTFSGFGSELRFARQTSTSGKWTFEQINGSAGMEFEVTETAANAKTLHTRAGGNTTLEWAPDGMTIISLSAKDGTCKFKINGEECTQKIVLKGSDVTIESIPNEGYEFVYWLDDHVTTATRTITNIQEVTVFAAQLQIPTTKEGVWSENASGSSEVMYLTWNNTYKMWEGQRNGHDIELTFVRSSASSGSWMFIEETVEGHEEQYAAEETSPNATILHANHTGNIEIHWFMP